LIQQIANLNQQGKSKRSSVASLYLAANFAVVFGPETGWHIFRAYVIVWILINPASSAAAAPGSLGRFQSVSDLPKFAYRLL